MTLKFYLLNLSVLICSTVYAQKKVVISNAPSIKRGIYRSFEELKYNSPSAPFSYPLKVNWEHYDASDNSKTYVTYRLIDSARIFNKKQVIWGFSDGRFVYIIKPTRLMSDGYVPLPASGSVNLNKLEFIKLGLVGRYCYFETLDTIFRKSADGSIKEFSLRPTAGKLDINSGKLFTCGKTETKDSIKLYNEQHGEEVMLYQKAEKELYQYVRKELAELLTQPNLEADVTDRAMKAMIAEMLTGLTEMKDSQEEKYAYGKAARYFVNCGSPIDYYDLGSKLSTIKAKNPWMLQRHFRN